MATLRITFTGPTPAPSNGYRISYRKAGTADPYQIFTAVSSPAEITVEDGFDYEGIVQSDCGAGNFSTTDTFLTDNGVPPAGSGDCYAITIDTNDVEYNAADEISYERVSDNVIIQQTIPIYPSTDNGDGTITINICSASTPNFYLSTDTLQAVATPQYAVVVLGATCTGDGDCTVV